MLAGFTDTGIRQAWETLASGIERAAEVHAAAADLLLRWDPKLPQGCSAEESERVAGELVTRFEERGAIGFFDKFSNRPWSRFIKAATVSGAKPCTKDHFDALKAAATLAAIRVEVGRRWAVLVEASGGPGWADLGERPELGAEQIAREVRRLLRWRADQLEVQLQQLRNLGFRWEAFIEAQPAQVGERAALESLLRTLTDALPPVLAGRHDAAGRAKLEAELRSLAATLRAGPAAGSPIQRGLAAAVDTRDEQRYRRNIERAELLAALRGTAARRSELLERLHGVAPSWSECVRHRTGVHGGEAMPPGDPDAAWRWLQLNQELERRAATSLPALQARLEKLESDLRKVTVKLIDRRAWSSQMERTSLPQQQALVGWLDLVRRIGKGTGKRAPALRAEAARQMRECRSSVPVWIMPLARVAEMFDPSTRFDVVIIDEASQSDVMGLVALYMGKRVVVVGDHEQVSPSAVGQQLDRIVKLIDQYLTGIPNGALYDGRTSIYDLARQSFGGLICLTEHFRCFPQIIEFSNWLSYNGRIKPLREPSRSSLLPFVVPLRVQGAERIDKVNAVEAANVASLLVACTREPEYRDATFGVVSLLGDEQALEIDRLLRQHLPESDYVNRRVLCGNAAHFQGDERDVMFLSMVHAPNGGPLSLLTDAAYQQRFNVAASRARDQMWVLYSIDPQVDLKPGDLRRRLIEHALDPEARARELGQKSRRVESDFERRVLERLVAKGYRVQPQHSVGAYRIDLVVDGEGGRLAVECDGERYHTAENLDEDMARQSILERLGWKFVRIRGSVFYRDPDRAMAPVFERLAALGIDPRREVSIEPTVSKVHLRVVRAAAELRALWGLDDHEASTRRGVLEPLNGCFEFIDPERVEGTLERTRS